MSDKKPKSNISTLDKLMLRQRLTRCFLPNLKPAEYLVLDYIFDRTVMWDRLSSRITVEEFTRGNKLNGGLPISERTIKSALKTLRQEEVVRTSGDQRTGITYEINFAWPGAYSPNDGKDSVSQTTDSEGYEPLSAAG